MSQLNALHSCITENFLLTICYIITYQESLFIQIHMEYYLHAKSQKKE